MAAFSVVADYPTCTDTTESTVLDQHSQYSLLKPVYDASSGVKLDPAPVAAARKEELQEGHKHKVWREVLRGQA